jgi:hypothetical protein
MLGEGGNGIGPGQGVKTVEEYREQHGVQQQLQGYQPTRQRVKDASHAARAA